MAKREANCGKPEKQEEQTHKQEAQSRALLLALRAVGQELREPCSFLGYDSGPSEVPRELLGRWAKGPAGNSACLPLWRRSCTPHRLWALSQHLVLLNHGARRKINTFCFLLAPGREQTSRESKPSPSYTALFYCMFYESGVLLCSPGLPELVDQAGLAVSDLPACAF